MTVAKQYRIELHAVVAAALAWPQWQQKAIIELFLINHIGIVPSILLPPSIFPFSGPKLVQLVGLNPDPSSG